MNKEKLIERIDENIDTFSSQREATKDRDYERYCDATIYGIIVAKEIIQSEPEETCTFIHDEDTDAWTCSECGLKWVFMEGTTPKENDMNFCPKCGRKLIAKEGE